MFDLTQSAVRFINYLNPYVCHLDPVFHTFELVQQRSSFLLTVILSATAKIFNESIHPLLLEHTEKLLAEFLVSYEKVNMHLRNFLTPYLNNIRSDAD